MRPLTIDLAELAFALNSEDLDHHLDLLSGKIILLLAEDADPELEALLREEPERFVAIEPLPASAGLGLMQEFLQEVSHPQAYIALEQALAGRKAVRTFNHILMGYPPLLQAWQDFEAARLHELALDWLDEHELQPAS
ncbi:UPF0158 family protein [Aquipseudomonas ullengensis]|uniref:Uncharacterized protein n=1 Tax=Aquipseudomonas ullengensis TaxID=2759166 RepID=A0A7W4LIR3_9GAMM|nr:UPF0158 family protein [Pseudomonas ullengensis]MBB2493822.1 hypothetical protein [Pseudomonas ullengensis]